MVMIFQHLIAPHVQNIAASLADQSSWLRRLSFQSVFCNPHNKKAMVCTSLFVGVVYNKVPLLLIKMSSPGSCDSRVPLCLSE